MRRTAGERGFSTIVLSASVSLLVSGDGFFFSGALSGFCSGTCCLESSISAMISPILTSCPSGTFVSSTPDFSATISVETLSVSSAKSGSPSFTKSPDFLCQAETTPLVTDSPTDGTFTSIIIAEIYPACAGPTQRRGRGGFRQQEADSPSSAFVGQALRLPIPL